MSSSPSHVCEFTRSQLFRAMAGPVLASIGMALLLHLLAALALLPGSAPGNLDETLLQEKVRLAADPESAAIVLLGDSSCLMNVDARVLAATLHETVLNLATVSHVDLAAQGELLRRFVQTHATPPSDVVLLLHPEALWRTEGAQHLGSELRRLLDMDPGGTSRLPSAVRWPGSIPDSLGGRIFRTRLLQPSMPVVLRGGFARRYGTTWEISRTLRRRRGSLDDPASFRPGSEPVRSEYRFDPRHCETSQSLRAEVPPGTRLWIGVSPLPLSVTDARHAGRMRRILDAWGACLGPAGVLTNLPDFRPDHDFATLTHLTPDAALAYTGQLANAIRAARGQAPAVVPRPNR